MLLAYLDEVGEPDAYVSKHHKRFNTSPAFGYAGFIIPAHGARLFGACFAREKERAFPKMQQESESPGRWERKGSDIFTRNAWSDYRYQIRIFRGLARQVHDTFNGKLFYFVVEKQRGTGRQVGTEQKERIRRQTLEESINRICTYAFKQDHDVMILMDQINENERIQQMSEIYSHVFSRTREHPEMRKLVEPPMYLDSKISSNIQFADWIAASVSRTIDYQLEKESAFTWIPQALSHSLQGTFTHESKLHLWKSAISDIHNDRLLTHERPALHFPHGLSAENLERLQKVKAASFKPYRPGKNSTPPTN